MIIAATAPFGALLGLFALVPLGILAAVFGSEYAGHLRRRPRSGKES